MSSLISYLLLYSLCGYFINILEITMTKTVKELKALLKKIRDSKNFRYYFQQARGVYPYVTYIRLYRELTPTFKRYQLSQYEVDLIMYKLMEIIKQVAKQHNHETAGFKPEKPQ